MRSINTLFLAGIGIAISLAPHAPLAVASAGPSNGDPGLDAALDLAAVEHLLPDEDCMYTIEPAGGTIVIIGETMAVPHLDIKPGSCPNPINVHLTSDASAESMFLARVPMSILGNAFDVTQVDVTTVRLSRVDGNGLSAAAGTLVVPVQTGFADTGTPFHGTLCSCHALGGDGFLDLDLKFDRAELVLGLGLDQEADGATVPLRISGRSLGWGFRIKDCVKIINNGSALPSEGD